jgi:hypothetical protein
MAKANCLPEGLLAFPPTSRSVFTGTKALALRIVTENKIHIYVVNTLIHFSGKFNGFAVD